MARKSRRIEKPINTLVDNKFIVSNKRASLATAAYVRLSVEKDTNDSIETQIAMLKQFIEVHKELELTDVYADNGFSGTNFVRPEFGRLMDDARTGKIQCIVVKDLSRFGRDFLETGYYIETLLPNLNIRFISINDEFDSAREEDKNSLAVPIKNLINEMYAKDISKKRSVSDEIRMRNGQYTIGRSVYGYVVDKKQNCFVENPDTAPYVRLIFRWNWNGVSPKEIAERLEVLGVMTPSTYKIVVEQNEVLDEEDKWTAPMVRDILKNQSYIGDRVQGKRKSALYKNQKEHPVEEEKWIIHHNVHQPLVSGPEYVGIRKSFSKMKIKRKQRIEELEKDREHLHDSFPSMVRCMECNRTMHYIRYAHSRKKRNFKDGAIYQCKVVRGSANCNQIVHEDFLKIVVMDQIQMLIQNMCDKKEVIKKMRCGKQDNSLLNKIDRINEKSTALYENYAEGIIDIDEFICLKEQYATEKENLQEQQKQVEERFRNVKKNMDEFLNLEKRFEQYIGDRTFNEKLIHELVDCIYVSSKGAIEIKFKCDDVFSKITEKMEMEVGV
ncbi:MAG: recombinase family protein [Anaerostipes sp.]|nr:recombinase family protein [Anaerostipes sp.]